MKRLFTKTFLATLVTAAAGLGAQAQSCNASFTYNIVGMTVNVVSTSTGTGPNTSYTWSWGDTQFGSGSSSSHTYSAGGSYVVCLGIYDLSIGCYDSACQTVVIPASGVEDFYRTFVSVSASPNPASGQAFINYTTTAAGD